MNIIHRQELMKRVESNLTNYHGEYEVTQLLSSFLLTLHLNWDDLNFDQLPQDDLRDEDKKWPKIQQVGRQQPSQALEKIRDALAHGLIAFEANYDGEISVIHLWTCPDKKKPVDWHAAITVAEMRQMLDCFMIVARNKVTVMRQPKHMGDVC